MLIAGGRFFRAFVFGMTMAGTCSGNATIAAQRAPSAVATGADRVVVLADHSMPGMDEYENLGKIDALVNGRIERGFLLINSGARSAVLERCVTSCHCVEAVIEGSRIVPSGCTTRLRTRIDRWALQPGKNIVTVTVFLRGRRDPAVTIRLAADVEPAIVFDPPQIDLDRLRCGETRTFSVRVRVDRRLVEVLRRARLMCSCPELQVAMGGDRGDIATPDGRIERTYSITLSAPGVAGPIVRLLCFRQFLPFALVRGEIRSGLPGVMAGAMAVIRGDVTDGRRVVGAAR